MTTFIIGDGSDINVNLQGIGSTNIKGTDASETIIGGGATDVVNAGGGEDFIVTTHGEDRINAGEGNDTVKAGFSNDFVRGEGGDDELYGGGGDDRIFGGSGEDRIIGGNGDDVMRGGDLGFGNSGDGFADTFVFDMTDGRDKIWDFETGIDTLEMTDGGSFEDLGITYKSGHTFIEYGDTTIILHDVASVSASDFDFV